MKTFEDLKRRIAVPSFYHVPIGSNDQGFLLVSQEEKLHHEGNILNDVRYEDCLPFEELSKNCVYKCLPVIAQSFYEESVDRPKCEIGYDHVCMFNGIWQVHIYYYLIFKYRG